MSKLQNWILALTPLAVVGVVAGITLRELQVLWLPFAMLIFASLSSYWLTDRLIHHIKAMTLKAGLFGLDINKKGTPDGEKRMYDTALRR